MYAYQLLTSILFAEFDELPVAMSLGHTVSLSGTVHSVICAVLDLYGEHATCIYWVSRQMHNGCSNAFEFEFIILCQAHAFYMHARIANSAFANVRIYSAFSFKTIRCVCRCVCVYVLFLSLIACQMWCLGCYYRS